MLYNIEQWNIILLNIMENWQSRLEMLKTCIYNFQRHL